MTGLLKKKIILLTNNNFFYEKKYSHSGKSISELARSYGFIFGHHTGTNLINFSILTFFSKSHIFFDKNHAKILENLKNRS